MSVTILRAEVIATIVVPDVLSKGAVLDRHDVLEAAYSAGRQAALPCV